MKRRLAGIGNRGHASAVIVPFVVAVGIAAALFSMSVSRAGTPAKVEAVEAQPAAAAEATQLWAYEPVSSGDISHRGFNPTYSTPEQWLKWWGPSLRGRVHTLAMWMPSGHEEVFTLDKRETRKRADGTDYTVALYTKQVYFAFDAWLNLRREATVKQKLAGYADPKMWAAFAKGMDELGVKRAWYLGKVDHLEAQWRRADPAEFAAFVLSCVEFIPVGDTIFIDDANEFTPDSVGWRIVQVLRQAGYVVGTEPSAKRGSAWERDAAGVSWSTAVLDATNTTSWKVSPMPHREVIQLFGSHPQSNRPFEALEHMRALASQGKTPMPSWGWLRANPSVNAASLR